MPNPPRIPTSEELESEDRALEEKYQRLLKKRQKIDEQIAETAKALEEGRLMNQLLKQLEADVSAASDRSG